MIKLLHMNKWILLILVGGGLFYISGCASPHYPDYPSKSPSEYKSHAEKKNLSVAAEALDDPKEVKKYFGSNLLDDGILPVHIVVINNSPKESYVLLKENVQLLNSSKISSDDRQQVGHNAESIHDVGLILLSPALSAYGDTQAIGQRESFALKEFQQESIEPGQRASGFVYFRCPNLSSDDIIVRTELIQPLTGQKVIVDLKL